MKRSIFFLSLFCVVTSVVFAQIPQTISYQGVLSDATGAPVADGNYTLVFKLYASATGGTALWTETQTVTVTSGVLDAVLGSLTPLNLPFTQPYWLGITINNQTGELLPRIELTSAAYSLSARTVPDGSINSQKIAKDQVVKSLNGLKDDVRITAGANVTVTTNGDAITIAANTNGGSGGNTLDMAYDQGGPGAGRQITADAGAVKIAGASESEALVVDGKVGIGVANPQAKLDVKYWPAKQLRLSAIGSSAYWDVFHNASSSSDYGLSFSDHNGTEYLALNRLANKNSVFLKSPVGIGTADPRSDLHIYSDGDPKFRFTNGNGTEATLVYNTDSGGLEFRMGGSGTDPKLYIGDSGKIGIGTVTPAVPLEVFGTNLETLLLQSSHTMGTRLTFKSTATGGRRWDIGATAGEAGEGADKFIIRDGDANATRFVIDKNGHFGFGTESPSNILTVARYSSTDPVADAWTTYSSKRWKTNIQTIKDALDKVKQLRGVSYDWKQDNKHDIGLIAEEVGQVIPEVVVYEENGIDARSVDYPRLVAVLIEAMKEQQQEIDKQRDNIHVLQQRLQTLESR
ncbi:tail fiber domain-containing protein [candidate division KSB1 bacterium]|nr:tail fiber domain-containing protein [candidate division KSB1 bacterium]